MLHLSSVVSGDEPVAGVVLGEGSHGWEYWAWEEKSYLVGKEVGALASFDFIIRGHAAAPSQPQKTKPKEKPTPNPTVHNDTATVVTGPGSAKNGTESEEGGTEIQHVEEESPQQAIEDAISEKEDEISDIPDETPALRKFAPLPLAARPGGPIDPFTINDDDSLRKRDTGIGAGAVLIGYQRSAILGLGSVYCWVDEDREEGTTINGYWDIKERNMGM
jgi:hypothetical protein